MGKVEDTIIQAVLRDVKKRKGVTVKVHVFSADQDVDEFIQERLAELRTSKLGEFSRKARGSPRDKNYYYHPCVRGGKKAPKSWKNTECGAYVAFKEDRTFVGYVALVETYSGLHSGHDVASDQDCHHSTIDEELKEKIVEWFGMGIKTMSVWMLAIKWAGDNGHTDINDRKYFPTPNDVKNIRDKVLKQTQMHPDDATSVDEILNSLYQSDVIFYQQYQQGKSPFVAVLQSKEMKTNFERYGSSTVFLDATNSVNSYGFPLFTLLVKDQYGRGVPICHIIVSDEDQATLTLALKKLREAHPTIIPR